MELMDATTKYIHSICNLTMGDADDFSRDPISVAMDSSRINKPTSAAAQNTVNEFHKKVVAYDGRNFPASNQNTFCW